VDFKVRITEEALVNLEEILEYSWINFPDTAASFGNTLLEHLALLERFPRLGSLVPDRPGIRKLLHTPIRIYYRLDEDRRSIEIVHFWHGARLSPPG
jgi:plasmid stabilization system protein ParE